MEFALLMQDDQLEGLRADTGLQGQKVDPVGQRSTLIVLQDEPQNRRVPSRQDRLVGDDPRGGGVDSDLHLVPDIRVRQCHPNVFPILHGVGIEDEVTSGGGSGSPGRGEERGDGSRRGDGGSECGRVRPGIRGRQS